MELRCTPDPPKNAKIARFYANRGRCGAASRNELPAGGSPRRGSQGSRRRYPPLREETFPPKCIQFNISTSSVLFQRITKALSLPPKSCVSVKYARTSGGRLEENRTEDSSIFAVAQPAVISHLLTVLCRSLIAFQISRLSVSCLFLIFCTPFTKTARSLLRTLDSIKIPCSVKERGKYLIFPHLFKITFCDLEDFTFFPVS